jgi:hypothetical protein
MATIIYAEHANEKAAAAAYVYCRLHCATPQVRQCLQKQSFCKPCEVTLSNELCKQIIGVDGVILNDVQRAIIQKTFTKEVPEFVGPQSSNITRTRPRKPRPKYR